MNVHILGCSGGIGQGLRTTCLQLGKQVLIDCGTGVGDLTIEQMSSIRHIFLTHSHIDHIVGLPLLIDSIYSHLIAEPLTVHCLPQTYEALRSHVFNNVIWPDFFALPNKVFPVIRYRPMQPNEETVLGEYTLSMIEAEHTVPAVAYYVRNRESSFVFSGDTTASQSFWNQINSMSSLSALIVECAFPEQGAYIAGMAKHYYPSLLAKDLKAMTHRPTLYISHMQPGQERDIMRQLNELLPGYTIQAIHSGEIISI